ncbi:MAG: response regulator [bacterium]
MTANPPAPAATPNASNPAAGPPPRPWIILVVDDELDVRNSLTELLEQSLPGTKVLAASSGRLGLEILERERVDLVMSDHKMPGMDGIEFLVQVRRMRPQLPRMMFTAFADKTLAQRAVAEAVVSDFLAKNLTPAQTVHKVEALLRYSPSTPSEESKEGPEPFLANKRADALFAGSGR